jgi:glyoxylase-like metal-dependent hydrolase (beta-lactamase superfamily II)
MLRASAHGPITRIEMARTFLGRPLYEVSAYLLDDTLIDSGPPGAARELLAFCSGREVRRIVHTHYHEDHTGGDALLAAELGVDLLAPADTVARLADFYRLPLYRRVAWGQPANVHARPFGDALTVGPYTLHVVPTPGHSDDHVCLFEPERRWLFAGDLYISPRARYIRSVEDPWTIVASLRRVAALAPELLVCSHAGFVEPAVPAIEAKIAYWEQLAEAARSLVSQGLSERAAARRLLGREGFLTWFSLGSFSKRNLVHGLLRGRTAAAKARH